MCSNKYKPNDPKTKLFYLKQLFIAINIILSTISTKSDALDAPTGKITFPNGKTIDVIIARGSAAQTRGLSGVKANEFPQNSGMLFIYNAWGMKTFWMPDTYFNLDIIFLDPDLKIIYIEKNMVAHPGMENTKPISYTKSTYSFHVLEVRADANLTSTLKIGDQLIWVGTQLFSKKN